MERAESTGLDDLHAAIQAFSNSLADDADDAGMVSHGLVVWEETSFGDDGTVQRQTLYAATGDGSTPSGALGLALNLLRTLERDIVGCRCGD